MINDFVDACLLLLAGLYTTAFAFGLIPAPRQTPAAREAFMRKYGTFLRFCGPALVAASATLLWVLISRQTGR